MEKNEGRVKAGFSRILWAVMLVLLFATPCIWAAEVTAGDTLNLNSAIMGDWLDVYGTLNMSEEAFVQYGINANPGAVVDEPGGTVNVYGCAPGNTLFLNTPTPAKPGLPPVVNVFGPKFRIGTTEYSPPISLQISGPLEVLDENGAQLFSLTIYSQSININLKAPPSTTITVDIDIKPGSYPNAINLGSNGVIPVAILSTPDLDATTINPDNVFLAGSSVAVRGKGNKYLASEEDVNGDSLLDLVVKVETENLDPGTFQDGYAILQVIVDNTVIYEGSDEITIVPPE